MLVARHEPVRINEILIAARGVSSASHMLCTKRMDNTERSRAVQTSQPFEPRADERNHFAIRQPVRKAHLGDLYTESGQTLQGSLSAVSTPTIARVGSFFSIFRALKISTPLHRSQRKILQKFSPLFLANFLDFSSKFTIFHHFFAEQAPCVSSFRRRRRLWLGRELAVQLLHCAAASPGV